MSIRVFKYVYDVNTNSRMRIVNDVIELDHGIKVLTPPQSFLQTYYDILRYIPDENYILCPLSLHDGDLLGISMGVKGKMKHRENFLDTAVRELKEEVGLNIAAYQKPIINTCQHDTKTQYSVFYLTDVNRVSNTKPEDIKVNLNGDIKNNKICVLIHGQADDFLSMMTQTPRYLINDGENIAGFSLVPKALFARFIMKFEDLFKKYIMANFYCIFYDKNTDLIYENYEDYQSSDNFRNCIYSISYDGIAKLNTDITRLRYWNTLKLRSQFKNPVRTQNRRLQV